MFCAGSLERQSLLLHMVPMGLCWPQLGVIKRLQHVMTLLGFSNDIQDSNARSVDECRQAVALGLDESQLVPVSLAYPVTLVKPLPCHFTSFPIHLELRLRDLFVCLFHQRGR